MLPLSLNRESITPLQLQIFQYYFQAIQQGGLLCGDKLPSIRELALRLNVAKITVVMAYEKLTAAGYIKSRQGVGYEVIFTAPLRSIPPSPLAVAGSPPPPVPDPAGTASDVYSEQGQEIYCRMGIPDPNAFPWSSWRKWNNVPALQKEQLMTRYHSPNGLFSLREQVVRYLNLSRGINTTPDNIIITNGIQEGLALLGQIFILHQAQQRQEICHIVTESPCYSGAWHLFNYYGAAVTPVSVDRQGICTDKLPECNTHLCYVTPAHQYPLGYTLSLARREALLRWALRVGAYIIEDDYDAVFTYSDNPLPALKAMDYHDRVIYTGTFSKTLGPGVRLGYLVCPDALLPALQNMKALSNNGSQWLLQQFLAELMQNQVFYTHISKLACQYAARQALLRTGLAALFSEGELGGVSAGLHLSLRIPWPPSRVAQLRQRCLHAGIRFDTITEIENGSEIIWQKENRETVMLFGFGGLPIQQIHRVLAVLEREIETLKS
ncbi:PLP-dependent aminotransferase family protein [Salmonella bongori]|uniref:PLP-dependent aminotransferase family protein n=1 Tax=Salmonella bongori TaxID=54736 RepID=A0A8F8AXW6_SALBN|nr:PLP-dependent aminotransferase family protein [Salmonella bongori]ECG1193109.1 PLP-dependent aminotransferase family protein [Salmonella bongori]EDP8623946.1 PLP-dependent aminotransferase family protein [Salmonella bongori]QXY86185.1 PLP-dependent aminotransferase family protein [Salmonella bongori]